MPTIRSQASISTSVSDNPSLSHQALMRAPSADVLATAHEELLERVERAESLLKELKREARGRSPSKKGSSGSEQPSWQRFGGLDRDTVERMQRATALIERMFPAQLASPSTSPLKLSSSAEYQ
eukprot:CAMPEP_0173454110 /NCGR_PEP_ID=MMETSP1357-20121228/51817_1 /TAXON_ID=77926 /ORGANISM="Hemiselmis rufescens, Strain PCC563" /LENGTH=123 /DNA_ID=CAMNT_0014421121 /DNA_START=36 /DNA_END=407 /DNA_ORIENTATION=+